MRFIRNPREKREKISDRQKWVFSIIDEMKSGKEKIETSGLYEHEARLLEHYAQQYGYQEDAMFDNGGLFQPQKFKLIFTKTQLSTALSQVSQTLGIPQDDMTVLKVELTSMVQCEFCQTQFDLNQQSKCPHCGGKPKQ